jgi:hypothetical protein
LIAKKKEGASLHIFLFLFYKTPQKTKSPPGEELVKEDEF